MVAKSPTLESPPVPNGNALTPAPSGKRIPRVEDWFPLPEPYDMLQVQLWVDYPVKLEREIKSGDEARFVAAARQIILAHDGWEDDEGVLPQPSAAEFWERVPTHLLVTVLGLLNQAATTLPNSLRATKPG